MRNNNLVNKTASYIKEEFSKDGTGHDWWHVQRVWQNAKLISKHEGGDKFIIEMAVLLHDLDDWKFSKKGDGKSINARKWLIDIGTDKKYTKEICEIIENVSFKGGFGGKMTTKEGKIVQDADRLDALGAIGIARTFVYGGHKGRIMYDPSIKPLSYKNFADYKKQRLKSPTLNHFYEKLFLLKDRMHTKTAKRIALKRTKYMKEYVAQFMAEWNGQDK